MPRCEHHNVEIREYITGVIRHRIELGITRTTGAAVRDGVIEINCLDCSYSREFAVGAKRPRWVEQLLHNLSSAGMRPAEYNVE